MRSTLWWLTLAACQKHAPPGTLEPGGGGDTGEAVDTDRYTDMAKVAVGPAITLVGRTAEEVGNEGGEFIRRLRAPRR